MKLITLIMTSKGYDGYFELTYKDDVLVSLINETDLDVKHVRYVCENTYSFERLLWLIQEHARPPKANEEPKTKITIVEKPLDLSFKTFWTKYNYSLGSKPGAERRWKLLQDGDKALAIEMIKKYNKDLLSKSIEKCHGETYLSQRRFDNYI